MSKRRWPCLPQELRNRVVRAAASGSSHREIVAMTGVSLTSVGRVLKPLGGVRLAAQVWTPPPGQLTLDQRIEISFGLRQGLSCGAIGAKVGRHRSTIWREVANNGGPHSYSPVRAHHRARDQAQRPKATKLGSNERLCSLAEEKLTALWSPEQIADWLRVEFADDPEMWVSHETIYKTLYVQGRGELRRELAACLRTGRAKRKTRGRLEQRGKIKDMVNISERPPQVEDRAVPGHWEGDLIMGANNSAVGTLVERTSRYVMFLPLPDNHGATAVRDAMTKAMATLPAQLCKSVTWDQGRELAEHVRFSIDTGIDVYFCDPHSPWQRGTNENTNGLARQYMPKGTNLARHSAEDLQRYADSLNTRPRKTLGGMTPLAKLGELVAAAA